MTLKRRTWPSRNWRRQKQLRRKLLKHSGKLRRENIVQMQQLLNWKRSLTVEKVMLRQLRLPGKSLNRQKLNIKLQLVNIIRPVMQIKKQRKLPKQPDTERLVRLQCTRDGQCEKRAARSKPALRCGTPGRCLNASR